MDKQLKDKWVEALRSGQYKQGFNCLKRINNNGEVCHCCLGVLCEVVGNSPGITIEGHRILTGEQGAWMVIAAGVRDNLGLKSINTSQLMYMNDDENKTFEEIADWIEENF